MMTRKKSFGFVLLAAVFAGGFVMGRLAQPVGVAQAQSGGVYELRTYTAAPGKLADLQARFRNHTVRLFEKHGMKNVGYWVPTDAPASDNTLIYVLEHANREAATASWDAFRADPDWQAAYQESTRDGRLAANVEAVFMQATDYSPMK